MASEIAAPGEPARAPSEGYRRLVLALLVLAYTFNFIDRTIINTIGQAIKEDLRLTDTELGLLGGLAFAVLYTMLGIPLARLADRRNRVGIIAAAIAVWSAFTAACGAAGSFAHLLLFRVGVGVGEAGLSPPAHSLISDYYGPRRRASALSVYSLGIPLGVMFGAVAGGWIADHLSWRAAFVLVGLPGLPVALAILWLIREPPRGGFDARPPIAPAIPGERDGSGTLREVVARMWRSPGIAHVVVGCTLVSLAAYGTSAYSAAYFIRAFGVSFTLVGLVFGVVGGIGTGIGTLAGGWLADRLGQRGRHWYALVPALGVSLALPLYALVYLSASWQAAAWLLFLPGFFHFLYVGPTFGVIQNAMPAPMRATAAAVLLFVVNIVGLGLGPPLCGWLIDGFSASIFDGGGLGAFSSQCPGGIGLEGGGAELDALCRSSVATGSRRGILLMLVFFAWGAFHYFASAARLSRARRAGLEEEPA